MSAARITEDRPFPATLRGELAAVLEPSLARVASADGRRFSLVSLALEAGALAAEGDSLTVEAWVERSTRTLVFAAAEARRSADQALVASGSAVFKLA